MQRYFTFKLVPIIGLIFSSFGVALFAYAANEVTVPNDTTLNFSSDGTNYTLKQYSKFDSMTVGASSFDFVLSKNGHVTLVSTDRKVFTITKDNTITSLQTCASNQSTVDFYETQDTTITIHVTTGSLCAGGGGDGGSSGSSGGSSGSSGGGGSVTPVVSTPVVQTTIIPVPVVSTPAVTITLPAKVLSRGMSDNSISDLQTLLTKDKDVYPEGLANGIFGPATERAIKRFQKKYGITQTGTVGPLTRVKILEVFAGNKDTTTQVPVVSTPSSTSNTTTALPAQVLSRGMSNDGIKNLQTILVQDKTLYPEGVANGIFGPATERAIKRFQKKYGITQTGAVGPLTREKLLEVFGAK